MIWMLWPFRFFEVMQLHYFVLLLIFLSGDGDGLWRMKNGIWETNIRYMQKATSNFTTIIGHGAFGSVYKAQMLTGETVAVKVLGNNSRRHGEKEFLTEEPLNWDARLRMALDVATGLEYLHYWAAPPFVHRDIKSSNILLDWFMRAKAAMEAESKVGWEEIVDSQLNGKYDVQRLNDMAALALKCVNEASRNRPSMRDIVGSLSHLSKKQHSRNDVIESPAAVNEVSIEVEQLKTQEFSSIARSNVMRRLHSR